MEKEARKRSAREEEYKGLMPTPQSENELNLGLAKLYAARVPQPRVTGLSHELTRTLVAMARQTQQAGRAERCPEGVTCGGADAYRVQGGLGQG